jgi:hypothetical protein
MRFFVGDILDTKEYRYNETTRLRGFMSHEHNTEYCVF